MKFTLSWLRSHIDINATVSEIENCLNAIGFEVENVTDFAKIYAPFKVAYIVDTYPHPNAEKLYVCTVDDGNEKIQIVCGAKNARSGIKVVLAPVGTTMPNGMQIKSAQIRGVDSHGMLCSFAELNLDTNSEGIIELNDDAIIGQKYTESLGLNDVLFDIAITPNRGDVLSVFGIARELSAAGLGELIVNKICPVQTDFVSKIKVTIEDKANCNEFVGRFVAISQQYSDSNIRDKLKKISADSHITLVNISNFVMYDMGRPNHIYDADKIVGNIIVRKAKNQEEFTALDGKSYILDEGVTVVADDEKILSIAGIIGGINSKVDENTKNIFIEIAVFDSISVALTGRKVNINSQAKYRFERRVDTQNSIEIMNHITSIIANHFNCKISEILTVDGDQHKFVKTVNYTSAFFEKHTGFKIDPQKEHEILNALGFMNDGDVVHIPPHRWGDVTQSIDIVEEILRIHGLDNIPSTSLSLSDVDLISSQHDKIRPILINRGYDEAITWSFCDEKSISLFDNTDVLTIKNPISSELNFMRTSVIPNLLKYTGNNLSRSIKNFSLFEIGYIYKSSLSDHQSQVISGIRIGNKTDKTAHLNEQKFNFFDIKADVFALIQELGLNPNNLSITKGAAKYYHPFKSATFKLGNAIICWGGEIHPSILKEFDIKANVYGFELYLDNLPKIKIKHARPTLQASPFQAVTRDFAFILLSKVAANELIKVIKQTNKDLIENVSIFDVYEGSHIDKGKKSIAVSVRFRSQTKTLSDKEIDEACDIIIKSAQLKLDAQLR